MARTRPKPEPEPSRLDALSDDAAHCRDLGHVWRPHRAEQIVGQGWARTLRCRSCGCHRVQYLDRLGHILNNRYRYPDNYLVQGGFGVDDRAELRMRALRKLVEDGGEG